MTFETTHWSLVLATGGDDSQAAGAALAALCESYWYPLYAFVRKWGASPDDARDLTQGFLASLLERRDFEKVRREKGRFRSFLLASLQHYLVNDAARRNTLKRGGGILPLALEFEGAEGRYRFEPASAETPETLFERRWAMTVIERVLARLRAEWEAAGRVEEYDQLKSFLLGEGASGYSEIAGRLNTTEGALRVSIHRLRRKFRRKLREEIAQTLSDPAEIDDEVQFLFRVLSA